MSPGVYITMRYNQYMKYLITIFLCLFFFAPAISFAQINALEFDTEIDVESLSEEDREFLTAQLRIVVLQLQVQISSLLQEQKTSTLVSSPSQCVELTQNMYIGDTGAQVTQLQQFLASLGQTIYPEAQITGKYGTLTRQAVERFQVLTDIFAPGQVGYGVTGPVTRETILNYCKNIPVVIAKEDNQTSGDQDTELGADEILASVLPSNNISSSLQTTQGSSISNSTLFNPDSSSIFLQYLNESQITGDEGVLNNQTITTVPSPTSKTISFSGVTSQMTVGEAYTLGFTQTNFSGFDLVTIEGYKDDIQYFFGSTVPALGTYAITIPQDFDNKDNFTLVIKHNNTIKDSQVITLTN